VSIQQPLSEAIIEAVLAKVRRARKASFVLKQQPAERKNAALQAMADALWASRDDILTANASDVERAVEKTGAQAKVDRLLLNEDRIRAMMQGLRQIASLADPIGEIVETLRPETGIQIEKVRVPFGVIAMIYESRPNVTVDAAGLALKTGNAVVLRGGKEALASNTALTRAMHMGLSQVGIPNDAVQFVDMTERQTVNVLISARGLVDLAIPRGGAGLIQHVLEHARVPVIETGVGNCHVYVDESADLEKATRITINGKTQRPSVCNAIETLLIHSKLAKGWLPDIGKQLLDRGVQLRVCPESFGILRDAGVSGSQVTEATDEDWATEYLDLILAVRIVDDVQGAVAHIDQYGSRHSEAIVTENADAAEFFLNLVDAAAVYHNASTRFTDGFEFGFGAEIGISTQKLHARGPMGLRELTTYKYQIRGEGQIRS
jgi:glutamate-5-semialdehyde dehydrogenase